MSKWLDPASDEERTTDLDDINSTLSNIEHELQSISVQLARDEEIRVIKATIESSARAIVSSLMPLWSILVLLGVILWRIW